MTPKNIPQNQSRDTIPLITVLEEYLPLEALCHYTVCYGDILSFLDNFVMPLIYFLLYRGHVGYLKIFKQSYFKTTVTYS
jgi:hypothetical protein